MRGKRCMKTLDSSRQSSRKTHLSSTHWAMTADTTTILVNKAFVCLLENGPTTLNSTRPADAGSSRINAAINLKQCFTARCVLCRAKILRLKQHHKGSQLHPTREKPTSASSSSAPLSESEVPTQHGGVPQSVSNYSITRLSSSSSNHSFASGN